MGKSECRHRLAELYPQAFCEDGNPGKADEIRLILHDSMQCIKGFTPRGMTWRSYAIVMKREMELAFQRMPELDTFVMCFDDYDRVFLAKVCEQTARTKGNERGQGQPMDVALRNFQVGPLDAKIPDEYEQAKHDRVHWCRELVRFLVRSWVTEPECRPKIPQGTRCIVSGHYLQPGDLGDKINVEANSPLLIIGAIPNDELASIGESSHDHEVRFMPEWSHTLGEGDFSMIYMLDKAFGEYSDTTRPWCCAAVYSIDTDMMFYLMRYLETRHVLRLHKAHHLSVLWRITPCLWWCTNRYPDPTLYLKGRNALRWCDIDVLQHAIRRDDRLVGIAKDNRVASLTAVCMASGNDFGEMLPLVTPQRWIDTFMINSEIIGSVAYMTHEPPETLDAANVSTSTSDTGTADASASASTDAQGSLPQASAGLAESMSEADVHGSAADRGQEWGWDVNGTAFRRLVECACKQAVKGNKSLYQANPGVNFGSDTAQPPRYPTVNEIIHRKHHLRFCLWMMNQIGLVEMPEPNLSVYHYGRPDRNKPPSRTNLVRLHGNANPDEWKYNDQPRPSTR